MYFVGREKETKKIIKSLEKGSNVIISGKYGIGRTSLIRHVAEITRDRWRIAFADFSLMPGEISRQLLSQFTSTERPRNQASSKSSRFQLTKLDAGKKKLVIVLDDIAKLTHKKLALLQYLGETKRFQFIALVESFLPMEDLFRLRADLTPSEYFRLSYIDRRSAREFFQKYSEKYGLSWGVSEIDSYASITKGYPLGMKEIVMGRLKQASLSRTERVIPSELD